MVWFWFGIMVVGAIIAIRVRLRFQARRCGVISGHDRGAMLSGFVGFFWPITIWFDQVRNPPLCNHEEHIMLRAQRRQELAMLQEAREQERALS